MKSRKSAIRALIGMAIIAAAVPITGCTTIQKAQRLAQGIEGDATVTIETFINDTEVVVKNARVEYGYYVADLFELDHRGKWMQTVIKIKIENYKRKIVKDIE